jgi:lipid-A-disaccharide synthase
MKYFLIAGERSGDLHAANLIQALKKQDSAGHFQGIGGDRMEAAGMELKTHYERMAYMGFWEVFKNLPEILGHMRRTKAEILAYKPDVLILVDYAGFNLRMASWAKKQGIRVFYYISPKVWAWNQKRALKIKATVDRMFVILPFEKDFFAGFDYPVDYVGNPLLDEIGAFRANPAFRKENNLPTEEEIIALIPGSRRQEIGSMLPVMLEVARLFPERTFVVGGIRSADQKLYANIQQLQNVQIVFDQTYDLMAEATAALVTSGTATLETALFELPQVVCYKTSGLSYAIAKRLIRVPYISLVNLIAKRELVPELIQQEMNPLRLKAELEKILPGGSRRAYQLAGYKELKKLMGEMRPSETTAALMYADLVKGGV